MPPFSALTDTFNASSIGSQWVDDGGDPTVPIVQAGGKLTITPLLDPGSNGYHGIVSAATYDLTGSAAFVQIPQIGTGSPNFATDTVLQLRIDSNNTLTVVVEDGSAPVPGSINFQYRVGGSPTTIATIDYLSVTMAWWRIRESGGTIFYDTAPDGATWTNRASVANPFSVTALKASLFAGSYSVNTSMTAAVFDNFNGTPRSDNSVPVGSKASAVYVAGKGAWASIRPIADVSPGGWTDQNGGVTDLHSPINELPFDDTTYDQASYALSDVLEERLKPFQIPSPANNFTFSYRFDKDFPGGQRVGLQVELRQGASTQIVAWTHTDISGDAVVAANQALTAPQIALITDSTDVRVRVTQTRFATP